MKANRPSRITLDAFSDPQLEFSRNNGLYNRFTNTLTAPVVKAKSVQVLSVSCINSGLQLNDQSQLMFFYYASATQAAIRNATNLRCVRLLPSWYVPAASFTAFVKNKYFTTVSELVGALNQASATGGDNTTYNPRWAGGQLTWSYDSATRKISVQATDGTTFIAPAAADDPLVADFLNNTGSFTNQRPVMNGLNFSGSYAAAQVQPFMVGQSMNARLGFAMGYLNVGIWAGSASQYPGCATSTGVPLASAIEADTNPILMGAQNVGVYIQETGGSGYDSLRNRNLALNVPISVPPLNVISYNATGVENNLMYVPENFYQFSVELRDELGLPFYQPPSWNTQVVLGVRYEDDE